MQDELSRRLTAAEDDIARVVRVASPERVRVRGGRRRRATTALSTAGLLVVALGTVAGVRTLTGDTAASGQPTAAAYLLQIPADLRLPHEGAPGWQRDDNPDAPAVFDGCAAADPTRPGRTDARTLSGPGDAVEQADSPTTITEQLLLFADAQSAQAAIAALHDGVRACGWIDPQMGTQLDGTVFHSQWPHLDMERVAGIQIGNAVFIVHSRTGGAGMSSAGGNETRQMSIDLCAAMDLCLVGSSAEPMASASPSAN